MIVDQSKRVHTVTAFCLDAFWDIYNLCHEVHHVWKNRVLTGILRKTERGLLPFTTSILAAQALQY